MGNSNRKSMKQEDFKQRGDEDKFVEEIKQLAKENQILVLSKTYCPYCKKAKGILNSLIKDGSNMVVVELDTDPEGELKQKAGKKIHGQSSVPQVWINDKFIGGCSDVEALQASGELKKLLA